MSKANSRIFVLIGLGVCFLATILLIFGLVGSTTMTTHMANGGFQTQVTSFGNARLFWLAIGMYAVSAITCFIGYIGALIKMVRLDQTIIQANAITLLTNNMCISPSKQTGEKMLCTIYKARRL